MQGHIKKNQYLPPVKLTECLHGWECNKYTFSSGRSPLSLANAANGLACLHPRQPGHLLFLQAETLQHPFFSEGDLQPPFFLGRALKASLEERVREKYVLEERAQLAYPVTGQ